MCYENKAFSSRQTQNTKLYKDKYQTEKQTIYNGNLVHIAVETARVVVHTMAMASP